MRTKFLSSAIAIAILFAGISFSSTSASAQILGVSAAPSIQCAPGNTCGGTPPSVPECPGNKLPPSTYGHVCYYTIAGFKLYYYPGLN